MDLNETRRANARKAMEKFGGVSKVSRAMGYSNPSYLTQIFGPNPTRSPTEKTMRRMEEAMGLRDGELDEAPGSALPRVGTASPLDAATLSRALTLVGQIVREEAAQVSPDRFATLVTMAYEDSIERGGEMREARIRQVVQLLR